MKTMIRSTLYLLLLVSLLGGVAVWLPGCKNPSPDPVDPDIPSSLTLSPSNVRTGIVDGMQSTTVSIPDDMSQVIYPKLPQPPANCRIVRITSRGFLFNVFTEALGVIAGKETIEVNGKNYLMFIEKTTDYRYDATGRIVEELVRSWRNKNDTISYQYQPTYIRYRKSRWLGERVIETDSLPLNSNGLSTVRPDAYRYGFHDANGYLVLGNWNKKDPQLRRIRRQVVDGNVRLSTDSLYNAGETQLQYLQFIAQPSLPNITPFYGKQSRQLSSEKLLSSKGDPYYKDGQKYRTRYVYLFDAKGRVMRMIAYGTPLDPAWPFVEYQNGIGIVDYEYDCP
jgi:hypothetical protein